MAAGNANQTTPVQIMHALVLCCTTQIMPWYYTNHATTILIPVRVLLH